MNAMGFGWDKSFLLGHKTLDDEHQTLFQQLDVIVNGLLSGAETYTVISNIEHLVKLFRLHFTYEERLMRDAACCDEFIKLHMREHKRLLEQFDLLLEQIIDPGELRALIRYLKLWFHLHICGLDKQMIYQIEAINGGMSPSDAYIKSRPIGIKALARIQDSLHKDYAEFFRVQISLSRQNRELTLAQGAMEIMNSDLEERVERRTAELTDANRQLRQDVKTQRKLLRELEEAQVKLLHSEKMAGIGQLAAGVAHEINNPVGYVNSNLSTLRQYVTGLLNLLNAYEDKEAGLSAVDRAHLDTLKTTMELDYIRGDILELLDESNQGLERVKEIVQDLKDFARAGERDWQEADLIKGLDSTLNLAWNEIKYKAEVYKEYQPLPMVRCLPAQLNQVFLNLLINAVQSITTKGTIYLRSGVVDDRVWIEVEYTGCGMPESILHRIFDPFFSTKPVGKGTGLGLAISYGIIQKHGGQIDVTSEPDRGTCFRIYLPINGPQETESK